MKGHSAAVTGVAHITGGGLAGNAERILPEGCRLTIDRNSWKIPGVFQWLQKAGNVDREEMFRVFNMGVGLVIVVRPESADAVRATLKQAGSESWIVGSVSADETGAVYLN
jgi:phosphoribosylformylglycinamidine cyclo-ligase